MDDSLLVTFTMNLNFKINEKLSKSLKYFLTKRRRVTIAVVPRAEISVNSNKNNGYECVFLKIFLKKIINIKSVPILNTH